MRVKPEDCYFCLDEISNYTETYGIPTAWITPKEYFDQNHCIYDDYIEFEGVDWLMDVTEGLYEQTDVDPHSDILPAMCLAMNDRLIEAGFTYSEDLYQFLQDLQDLGEE